ARQRGAGLALPFAFLGLDRPLHRPVDPGQDGRPGRSGQRRAARSFRRAVAADVLDDRRLGREARV
ncbi:MAG: hypothetical protein AVDCRST_MAG10-2376, partial [uncultured Acidimicrobiales bacterium]